MLMSMQEGYTLLILISIIAQVIIEMHARALIGRELRHISL